MKINESASIRITLSISIRKLKNTMDMNERNNSGEISLLLAIS